MSDYIGVVTTVGQAKIAAAIGGTALNLTSIRIGDGNGAPITPLPGMTDLVRRVGAAYPIVSSGRDPVNANHWRVTALIPVDDGPFDIREIAVFDGAGEMIAIARHVLVEKRSPAQGAAVELLTDIVFPVSETAQVTVQVQPAAAVSIFQMLRAGFTVVESATVTAPPGEPVLGRTHVVPAGATGAWAGLAGYLVQWNGIVWVAANVPVGFHVVDNSKGIDTGARWLERTAGGWEPGLSRLLQKQPGNYVVAGGTANALTITLDPAPSSNAALGPATPLRILITQQNNPGPVNLSSNGLPALPVVTPRGDQLDRGDLPAGYIASVVATGTSYLFAGVAYSEFRRRLRGNLTLWVRTDGNDNNDGSANTAGSAFQTIQAAWDSVRFRFDASGYGVVIRLGNTGTYNGDCLFSDFAGGVTLLGDEASPNSYIVTSTVSQTIQNRLRDLVIAGVLLDNTYNLSLQPITYVGSPGSSVTFRNISWRRSINNSAFRFIYLNGGASAQSVGAVNIFSGGGSVTVESFVVADTGGTWLGGNFQVPTVIGNTNMNYAGAFCRAIGGQAAWLATTFSGSATGKRYEASLCGAINTGGAGGTFLPGDIAGTTAPGGVYA